MLEISGTDLESTERGLVLHYGPDVASIKDGRRLGGMLALRPRLTDSEALPSSFETLDTAGKLSLAGEGGSTKQKLIPESVRVRYREVDGSSTIR